MLTFRYWGCSMETNDKGTQDARWAFIETLWRLGMMWPELDLGNR